MPATILDNLIKVIDFMNRATSFTYDANGNLTAECYGKQAEVRYQYDTENRLTAVYDKQKLLMAAAYDGRGSVTANTWQNGMVTDVYQYDPYGQVTYGSPEHTDFYGYNAESYNPNTGLEYLRARYYNADQGRFFQEDTYLGNIREPLTLNRYAYVVNSPMNYVDPSGHEAQPWLGIYNPNEGTQANQNGKATLSQRKERQENYLKKMMEMAESSGEIRLCIRVEVWEMLIRHDMDPESVRSAWESLLLPDNVRDDFKKRADEYIRYILGTKSFQETNEAYQIRLTVYNILVTAIARGYLADEVSNEMIDSVFLDYLEEREAQANLLGMVLAAELASGAQSKFAEKFDKWVSEGGSGALDDIVDIMKQGQKTSDGKNIITQIDDNTKAIFRMDVGDNAHSARSLLNLNIFV